MTERIRRSSREPGRPRPAKDKTTTTMSGAAARGVLDDAKMAPDSLHTVVDVAAEVREIEVRSRPSGPRSIPSPALPPSTSAAAGRRLSRSPPTAPPSLERKGRSPPPQPIRRSRRPPPPPRHTGLCPATPMAAAAERRGARGGLKGGEEGAPRGRRGAAASGHGREALSSQPKCVRKQRRREKKRR